MVGGRSAMTRRAGSLSGEFNGDNACLALSIGRRKAAAEEVAGWSCMARVDAIVRQHPAGSVGTKIADC